MPYIQKLYDICKASLSTEGPISEEALEKVRAVLDGLKPSHVGLEHEAQLARGWKSSVNGRNGKKGRDETHHESEPPIKYIHLHECDKFSIGIFCMSPGSLIPLHDHPRMTVLSKVLYGSLLVKAFDWIDLPASYNLSQGAARPAKHVRDCQMTAPCDTTILHPNRGGNLHCFKAVTPCALFDILSPPYSLEEEENGRNCSYFLKSPKTDLPVLEELRGMNPSEVTWLEVVPPPNDLVIGKGRYKGPIIRR
ncbi:unnamed protein product [Lathyrus sativus]|nr:unnamed protein product [Lathyrus sativus]